MRRGADSTSFAFQSRIVGAVGFPTHTIIPPSSSSPRSSWRCARSRRRYDLVYVHNMPDILVLSSLVPKALGAKVILDQHDPMPELMMTIFDLNETSRSVRLLRWLEKWSIARANLGDHRQCRVQANLWLSQLSAGEDRRSDEFAGRGNLSISCGPITPHLKPGFGQTLRNDVSRVVGRAKRFGPRGRCARASANRRFLQQSSGFTVARPPFWRR